MRLQLKGWVLVQAIALTLGLSAIANLEEPWHPVSDRNSSIENANATPLKPATRTPFSTKGWNPIFPL